MQALATYVGPLGIPLATLLLLTVGNSTSGATIGTNLMPSGARTLSELLPPGAAVRTIADLSYFRGSHVLAPLATLTLWAAGSAVLLAFRTTEQSPAAPAPPQPQTAPPPQQHPHPHPHPSGNDHPAPHRITTDGLPTTDWAGTDEGHRAPGNGTTGHPAFTVLPKDPEVIAESSV
ncbi:hypothetical protein [Streptomyces sp. NPDC002520]